MQDNNLKIPENKNFEYSLNEAYSIAVEKLAESDPSEIARRSGAEFRDGNLTLKYLGKTVHISHPKIEISTASGENLPLRERILILHYLLTANGKPLSGKPITFKEMPEGTSYFRTYQARTLKPIASFFGKTPEKLAEIAGGMGGVKAEFGDFAVTVQAFPRIPLTFVIWKGDDEFLPESNILYDRSVTDYLPVEDIIVLTETAVWKMVRTLKP